MKLGVLFLAAFFLSLSLRPAMASDGERKGVIIGLGAGFGLLKYKKDTFNESFNITPVSESKTPFITNFKLSYAATNRTVVYWSAKVSWFSMKNALNEDITITAGTGTIALSYFFEPHAPSWFVSTGWGYSTWMRRLRNMLKLGWEQGILSASVTSWRLIGVLKPG
ncbi:MAG: hypothetical protein V2A61_00090 [Calditrichota bacterium]